MILRRVIDHFHKQEWTAIAIDFVIVVIGVGVALYGQQWLSDRQQKADLREAEALLREHLFNNYANAKERQSVQACRIEAIQALAQKLLEPEGLWAGMSFPVEGSAVRALPSALRSPNRLWGSSIWEAGLQQGTFNQMDASRKRLLTVIFSQANVAKALQDDVYSLQARLKALAVPTYLSQSDRLKYYDILAELDDKSSLLELVAKQTADLIEQVSIDFSPEARETALNDLASANDRWKAMYGECLTPMTYPALDAQ